jgi:hypothetical protein
MTTRRVFCCLMAVLLVFGSAALVAGQMINPYLPFNAPAAEPPDPYNIDFYPKMSRTSYHPCPTCGLVAAQFLELPPMRQPFPGPFGIAVPVP